MQPTNFGTVPAVSQSTSVHSPPLPPLPISDRVLRSTGIAASASLGRGSQLSFIFWLSRPQQPNCLKKHPDINVSIGSLSEICSGFPCTHLQVPRPCILQQLACTSGFRAGGALKVQILPWPSECRIEIDGRHSFRISDVGASRYDVRMGGGRGVMEKWR